MELGSYGSQEKRRFYLSRFPTRFYSGTYRILFQITEDYVTDTVYTFPLNITEVLERTGITTNYDVDTVRLYRISRYGGIYNDTGLCLEQPIVVGE